MQIKRWPSRSHNCIKVAYNLSLNKLTGKQFKNKSKGSVKYK